MSRYTNYSECDFTAYTFDSEDQWPASKNKKYKKWRENLGSIDDMRSRVYEDWLNIARVFDDFWELEQFGMRLFYELSIEENIIDTTRLLEISFRQVHCQFLIHQVNDLAEENDRLRARLAALGDGTVPIGYRAYSPMPEHIIEKANKMMEQYKNGETKARSTIKHDYKSIEVGRSYRLLDRGSGFELMTHEDYNQIIDQ
ncbi:hypothetical protein KI655_18735 [Vibrio sp. D404a]|uniref:ParE family toxin-like protein n=1 Tax=unclassified Vibrio TaxID=2614977 RepID=UPI0025535223|nr:MULTISPECIES: hypothetical protein [unclassified Vibrio]MDK9739335.1 hypothetical protein [Vibrio sp. D404a]MDK9797630.1 hypothetical protein [Vibrio sp. D449a]